MKLNKPALHQTQGNICAKFESTKKRYFFANRGSNIVHSCWTIVIVSYMILKK